MNSSWRVESILVVMFAALLLSTGCKKAYRGELGTAVQEEGAKVSVTVVEAKLERLTVEGEDGPLLFAEPALAIKIKLENIGGGEHFYQPTHNTSELSTLHAPVLYEDPGPEAEPSTSVPGVYLDGNLLKSQQPSGVNIAMGSTIEDVFLFQPPAQDKMNLLLVVPPGFHGGKSALTFSIPYEKTDVPAMPMTAKGEVAKLGSGDVKVTGTEVTFVKMKDTTNGREGFSKNPVLKISYTVTNTGKSPLTYTPNHSPAGSEVKGMALKSEDGRNIFMRVKFGADREVLGQKSKTQSIAAGKSIDDFVVFERPPKKVQGLKFMVPGKILGQSGLAQFKLPFTFSDPPAPKALKN